MIPILNPFRNWYCPECGLTDRQPASVPNRWHPCPKLRGLMAPLLPEGMDAKVEAHDREDYVGKELVQMDPAGRPVMSITTTRSDGSNDVVVFAPTATGSGEAT